MRNMKFLQIAAIGLVASVMTFSNPAEAQVRDPYGDNPGADELVQVCRDFADNDIGLKRVRGLCNVFYRAEDPVGFCISLRDQGALGQFGYESQYDCIFDQGGPAN